MSENSNPMIALTCICDKRKLRLVFGLTLNTENRWFCYYEDIQR